MNEQSQNEIDKIDEYESDENVQITEAQIKSLLPRGVRMNLTPILMEKLNNMGSNCDMPQNLLADDFLGNLHLAGTIKGVGPEKIMNATKFCNLKRNMSNTKAWGIVFPKKYGELIRDGKQIENHVSMYNKTQLVQAIDEEMLIPVHLQYAPYNHAAIKELYKVGVLGKGGRNADGEEMTVTPLVKVTALKELAALTKQPERAKIDITVNQGEEAASAQAMMNDQLKRLADSQVARLQNGASIADVQSVDFSTSVIDAEIE